MYNLGREIIFLGLGTWITQHCFALGFSVQLQIALRWTSKVKKTVQLKISCGLNLLGWIWVEKIKATEELSSSESFVTCYHGWSFSVLFALWISRKVSFLACSILGQVLSFVFQVLSLFLFSSWSHTLLIPFRFSFLNSHSWYSSQSLGAILRALWWN